jgi:SAM-dependent methyltransferase
MVDLVALAREYPPELIGAQLIDVERAAFHLELALGAVRDPQHALLCDLGGGVGIFTPACVRAGFGRVVLVDDFLDPVNTGAAGQPALATLRRLGVEVWQRDLLQDGMAGIPGEFSVITAFDTLEHWHHSPRRTLQEAMMRLRPGGHLILGLPNCVDLWKRLTTLLGAARWSPWAQWYELPVFRGHVREFHPTDARALAVDLGLQATRIHGRNWSIRRRAAWADSLLRWRPSLCSDLYLIGRKREAPDGDGANTLQSSPCARTSDRDAPSGRGS